MITSRLILLCTGVCLLAAGGCAGRGSVEVEELRADNQRLTEQLTKLQEEASLLEAQRNEARKELIRQREANEALEKQLAMALKRDAPTLGEGLTAIEGGVALDQDFAFAKGSADLTARGSDAVGRLAALLQGPDYADTKVIVEGHTDNTPVVREETKRKFGDNWGLSAMRAAAVIRALQGAGIPARRLRGAFRGEYDPAQSNSTRDGQAANRRVEILVSL